MPKGNLEEILNGLDPDSYRMQLVNSAKIFKSNWVEFGEQLTKVASEKTYEQWGYKSFEDYCREEIRIKKATAIKLTNAYFFITKEDPEIINYSTSRQGLDLDAVSVLQKAKAEENFSPESYSELKSSVLEKGQSAPTIARKFKQMLNEETQPPESAFREQSLSLIQRLQKRLKPLDSVPSKYKEYLDEIADFLKTG